MIPTFIGTIVSIAGFILSFQLMMLGPTHEQHIAFILALGFFFAGAAFAGLLVLKTAEAFSPTYARPAARRRVAR